MTPTGMVLRMTMSAPEALEPARPRRLHAIAAAGVTALHDVAAGTPLTPTRRRALEILRDGPALPVSELARLAGCGPGVVRDLVRGGLLEERFALPEPPAVPLPDWRLPGPLLSPDQEAAAATSRIKALRSMDPPVPGNSRGIVNVRTDSGAQRFVVAAAQVSRYQRQLFGVLLMANNAR